MSFLDAFQGYHQIPLALEDKEKTAFVTPIENYHYKVMLFGLKNARSTYQRIMTRMFEPQLGKSIEIYVDDMVGKSKMVFEHLRDLGCTFNVLRKCYIITQRGIEVDHDQIKTINNLKPPQNPKEVQKLIEMIAALNQFISRLADRCRPFYLLINKWKGFEWSEDCIVAF
nr:retrovirus-related pol polyprotein from transposon 17.6 [Quercus suber]